MAEDQLTRTVGHDVGEPIQDRPRPRWRNTRLAGWVRNGQRSIAARRYVRAHNRTVPADAQVLNFFPMQPTDKVHIRKILSRLELRIGHAPGPGVTIAWDTSTRSSARTVRRVPGNAINARCVDISKGLVDRNWAAAAGYSITVDPLTNQGKMVVKSERNGHHDGRITDGPLKSRRDGYVYQRYVNALDDGNILEMRTGICAGEIPAVILKWRPATNWNDRTIRSSVHLATEVYSATEIRHLLAFADLMGLEYGELDVLRDRNSGLIYVLDANRTPYGPPRRLAQAEADRHADLMSDAFARLMATRS